MIENLHWVLAIRHETLTPFFRFFPMVASENFYLVLIALGYWSWKREIFRDLAILLCASTLVNVFLKAIFQIPRPTIEHLVPVLDPYGFPSGDVQVLATVWLAAAWYFKNRILWVFTLLLILLVGFSRIYLGVHSVTDVVVGGFIGTTVFLGYRVIKNNPQLSNQPSSCSPLNLKFFILFFALLVLYFLTVYPEIGNPGGKLRIAVPGMLLGVVLGEKLMDYIGFQFKPETLYPSLLSRMLTGIFGLGSFLFLRRSLGFFWVLENGMIFLFLSYVFLGFYFIYAYPNMMTKILKAPRLHEVP